MILIPVQYTGERRFFVQLLEIGFSAYGTEAHAFGGIAYSEHGNAQAGKETPFPQKLEAEIAPVILGYHPQACRAAIHFVKLGI
jgi:hypothetical protein